MENRQRRSFCIKTFISKQLGCKPPWYDTGISNLDPCNGTKSLEDYKQIVKRIYLDKALVKACYIENCQQYNWQSETMATVQPQIDNVTSIKFSVRKRVHSLKN